MSPPLYPGSALLGRTPTSPTYMPRRRSTRPCSGGRWRTRRRRRAGHVPARQALRRLRRGGRLTAAGHQPAGGVVHLHLGRQRGRDRRAGPRGGWKVVSASRWTSARRAARRRARTPTVPSSASGRRASTAARTSSTPRARSTSTTSACTTSARRGVLRRGVRLGVARRRRLLGAGLSRLRRFSRGAQSRQSRAACGVRRAGALRGGRRDGRRDHGAAEAGASRSPWRTPMTPSPGQRRWAAACCQARSTPRGSGRRRSPTRRAPSSRPVSSCRPRASWLGGWSIRTRLPEGSRTAKSRVPQNCSVGSCTISAPRRAASRRWRRGRRRGSARRSSRPWRAARRRRRRRPGRR